MPPSVFKYLAKGEWFFFDTGTDSSDDQRAVQMCDGHVWSDVSPMASVVRLIH